MPADLAADVLTGLCFGVEPSTNGAICHTIENESTTSKVKENGHSLIWFKASDWAYRYEGDAF